MKIYTRIVIDIKTGMVVELDSFEYSGPVALCKGGGGTTIVNPPAPAPTETELAIQREILATMQKPKTESEQLMDQYTIQILKSQIENLPLETQYKQLALEYMNKQIQEMDSPEAQAQKALESELTQWQLEGIKAAREMGAITGELSASELTALDTMEQNAITKLQTNVGIDAQKVMQKTVAEMVDRGVLQGDIGAQAIAEVGKRTQELLTQGISDIESTRMGQQLGLQSEKANRELAWRNALMSGALSQEQFGEMQGQNIMSNYLNQQQMQNVASQYSTGLSQQWEQTKLGAGISQWSQMAGLRGQEANRALEASIASSQAKASESASMWMAGGTAAGIGVAAFI